MAGAIADARDRLRLHELGVLVEALTTARGLDAQADVPGRVERLAQRLHRDEAAGASNADWEPGVRPTIDRPPVTRRTSSSARSRTRHRP